MQYSDMFDDLPADVDRRWLDWKAKAATDADGRLIGYGTDFGPEAVCYRTDLFEAAGLPTDRGGRRPARGRLGQLLRGRRAVHRRHVKACFDCTGATYQGMVNQLEAAYENPDGRDHRDRQPRGQGRLRRRHRGRARRTLGAARPVERRLDRQLPERRLRDDALPRLDARRHRGQRRGRQGLGRRQHLPRSAAATGAART